MARRLRTNLRRGEPLARTTVRVQESVLTDLNRRAKAMGWSLAAMIRHQLLLEPGEAEPSEPSVQRDPVSVIDFGRDHYSTLLYIESVCVDRGGIPEAPRMRCDRDRHPQFAHLPDEMGPCSPTRLANGRTLAHHDDWDCALDMELAGWIEPFGGPQFGAGALPTFRLTHSGWQAAHNQRRARAEASQRGK